MRIRPQRLESTIPPELLAIGEAYARLALDLGVHLPGFVLGCTAPPAWTPDPAADPAALTDLRHRGLNVATAIQQSALPAAEQQWLLQQVRAMLWLIRAGLGGQILFTEQVRMVLDVTPEAVADDVFEQARQALELLLPGRGPLAERWRRWQASVTITSEEAAPLLRQALAFGRERFRHLGLTDGLDESVTVVLKAGGPVPAVTSLGDGQSTITLPAGGAVRADRLLHLATRLGYGGWHTWFLAAQARFRSRMLPDGCVVTALGPHCVLVEGLAGLLCEQLLHQGGYAWLLGRLQAQTGLPRLPVDELQAIHAAEDALAWIAGNVALLLHTQGIRPRGVRHYVTARTPLDPAAAERLIEEALHPLERYRLYARLIGPHLVRRWVGQGDDPLARAARLLVEPHVPSDLLQDPA